MLRKTNIFYHLIRTRTCAYQGVKNNVFQKIFFLTHQLNDPLWSIDKSGIIYIKKEKEKKNFTYKIKKFTKTKNQSKERQS